MLQSCQPTKTYLFCVAGKKEKLVLEMLFRWVFQPVKNTLVGKLLNPKNTAITRKKNTSVKLYSIQRQTSSKQGLPLEGYF